MNAWYTIETIKTIDSPSIVLYKDRLEYNLNKMLSMVKGKADVLMPHVKTNKMPEVIKMMVSMGIRNFKASTISEAEIAANEKAEEVLIAHQLVGPKIDRLCALIGHFKETNFTTLIDNIDSLHQLNKTAEAQEIIIGVYIDVNSGMNRSGIELGGDLDKLLNEIKFCNNLLIKGLHVYDGHIRDTDYTYRKSSIETQLRPVNSLFESLKKEHSNIKLICGGTPSFSSHAEHKDRITSPGTCVLWDWGYQEKLTEQSYKHAALIICRVISKPTKGIITIDLGHKSVSAENPIDKRIKLLNLDNYELLSQSEEHGVLKVDNWNNIKVGDVYYGLPYHICPTINLHDEVAVISNGKQMDTWEIKARKRKLNF